MSFIVAMTKVCTKQTKTNFFFVWGYINCICNSTFLQERSIQIQMEYLEKWMHAYDHIFYLFITVIKL